MDARLEHGTRTHGADNVTMLLWYAIRDAGDAGITFDELITAVGPRINVGHAKRRYLASRRSVHKHNGYLRNTGSEITIMFADIDADRAKRYLVMKTLSNMRPRDRVRRDEHGRYRAGSRPRAAGYQEDENVLDPTGARTRVFMTSNETLRVIKSLLERHESAVRARPTDREWRAIERLVSLHEEALGWSRTSVNGGASIPEIGQ